MNTAATTDRSACVHEFGTPVEHCHVLVRVTRKWWRKCFLCRSRKCYAAMVRCIGCRVLVHETCMPIKQHSFPKTVSVVDASTNTEPRTEAVDVATCTEPTAVTVADVATNTEPTAATTDAATNTEPTAATTDTATNTEPMAVVTTDVATSMEPTAETADGATITEQTVAVATDVATDMERNAVENGAGDLSPAVLPVEVDLEEDNGAGDAPTEEQSSEDEAFGRLLSSSNIHMSALKEVDLENIRPDEDLSGTIDFLDHLAVEEGLTLLYEPHVPDVLVGDYSYMQLSISPIGLTTIGFGRTVFEAHAETAYNCLLYLKHSML